MCKFYRCEKFLSLCFVMPTLLVDPFYEDNFLMVGTLPSIYLPRHPNR